MTILLVLFVFKYLPQVHGGQMNPEFSSPSTCSQNIFQVLKWAPDQEPFPCLIYNASEIHIGGKFYSDKIGYFQHGKEMIAKVIFGSDKQQPLLHEKAAIIKCALRLPKPPINEKYETNKYYYGVYSEEFWNQLGLIHVQDLDGKFVARSSLSDIFLYFRNLFYSKLGCMSSPTIIVPPTHSAPTTRLRSIAYAPPAPTPPQAPIGIDTPPQGLKATPPETTPSVISRPTQVTSPAPDFLTTLVPTPTKTPDVTMSSNTIPQTTSSPPFSELLKEVPGIKPSTIPAASTQDRIDNIIVDSPTIPTTSFVPRQQLATSTTKPLRAQSLTAIREDTTLGAPVQAKSGAPEHTRSVDATTFHASQFTFTSRADRDFNWRNKNKDKQSSLLSRIGKERTLLQHTTGTPTNLLDLKYSKLNKRKPPQLQPGQVALGSIPPGYYPPPSSSTKPKVPLGCIPKKTSKLKSKVSRCLSAKSTSLGDKKPKVFIPKTSGNLVSRSKFLGRSDKTQQKEQQQDQSDRRQKAPEPTRPPRHRSEPDIHHIQIEGSTQTSPTSAPAQPTGPFPPQCNNNNNTAIRPNTNICVETPPPEENTKPTSKPPPAVSEELQYLLIQQYVHLHNKKQEATVIEFIKQQSQMVIFLFLVVILKFEINDVK